MPLPSRREDEPRTNYMSRCMSDETVQKEYPDQKQRTAVCISKACDGLDYVQAADFQINVEEYGFTEELTEDNWYCPAEAEYDTDVDWGEATEEWDVSEARPGLWENIRRKKDRMGKNYKPAKTEKEGRPTQEQLKRAQSLLWQTIAEYEEGQMQREQLMKMHHQLMEIEEYLKGVKFEDWTKDMISKSEIYIQNIYDFVESRKEQESYAEFYAEADKPGKDDPRRTPAPKKDQKKGSKKNKPDSAKDQKGKITFSEEVTKQLEAKVKEHNAKGKGSKATLGMLKAVYRRGAGAFSTSHAPKMSRHGWAIARVNAFLTLLRTGKPSNSNYTTDNDLLPKGHPRKSKAEVAEAAEYQGRKVQLGKPFRTPKGPKKFSVYVKNDKGNVVKVNFGDPNMKIKKSDPARRKSFRARHNCDNPGPRYKARYWSCRKW